MFKLLRRIITELSLRDIIELVCRIMWFLGVVLLIAIPYQLTTIMSLCYWGMNIGNLVCFFSAFFILNPRQSKVTIDIALLIVLVGFTALSLFASGNFTLTVNNIVGYIQLIGVFMSIYYSKVLGNSKKFAKFIGNINILISILFLFLSFQIFAYRRGYIIVDSLTLGYQNPNQTAIYLFINAVILLITINQFDHILSKIFIFAMILSDFYMIYQTDSRTSFFAIIIILIVFIFKKKKFKIPKSIILICILFPLAFLYLYTFMYKNRIYSDVEILGKTIYSGRETYFSEMLDKIGSSSFNLLFGIFSEFNNTHNSALSLLSFFGITGTVIYYINWLYSMFTVSNCRFSNKNSYIALISILAVHIHSSAEAAFILGGSIWTVFIASIFTILRSDQ